MGKRDERFELVRAASHEKNDGVRTWASVILRLEKGLKIDVKPEVLRFGEGTRQRSICRM